MTDIPHQHNAPVVIKHFYRAKRFLILFVMSVSGLAMWGERWWSIRNIRFVWPINAEEWNNALKCGCIQVQPRSREEVIRRLETACCILAILLAYAALLYIIAK